MVSIRVDKKYRCTYEACGAAFSRPDRLNTHIRAKHSFMMPYKCSECGQSFASQGYLTKHMSRHKKSIEGDQIVSDDSTDGVPRDEIGPITRVARCPDCDRVFRRKFQLRLHRAEAHDVSLPYPCTECEKSFALAYQLKRHLKTHEARVYKCTFPDCDYESDKFSTLRKHTATHKKLECKVCLKKFKRLDALQDHEKTKHSDVVQSFACDRPGCTKVYPRERSLRTHQRYSHDEPKYSCEKCGKRFRHNKTLKVHIPKCGSEKISPPSTRKSNIGKTKEKKQTKVKEVFPLDIPEWKLRRTNPLIREDQFNDIDRLALDLADLPKQNNEAETNSKALIDGVDGNDTLKLFQL